MSAVVHLLWFAKEMPEGEDDIELLIGVYSSDAEARAAIERMKDKPGFAEFPQGFECVRTPLTAIIGQTVSFWTESEHCRAGWANE